MRDRISIVWRLSNLVQPSSSVIISRDREKEIGKGAVGPNALRVFAVMR